MLESLAEIVFGGLFEIAFKYIIKYPAAFIVWCFHGFKRPFKTILEDGNYYWAVAVLFIIGIGIFIYFISSTTPTSSIN